MARAIPRSMADVVEQLELEGDLVVTVDSLRQALSAAGSAGLSDQQIRQVAYRLQREGWLGSVRSRSAWEFYPASRAGALGAGDRFIEFRAHAATHPEWAGTLAMESAAGLHGLAQRFPEREVLALPKGTRPPKPFERDWRVITSALPRRASTVIDDLRVWTVEALLVGVGERPASYRDMAGLAQWLPEAMARVDVGTVVDLLSGMSDGTVQRTAYLFSSAGNDGARDRVLGGLGPSEVVWFGPRRKGGRYDPATGVHDTVLRPLLSGGTGA